MYSYQRGQSYIEIVVVLLLLGISLTGMVISMLSSQQLSRHSIAYSDAVIMLVSISNTLRLNTAELIREQSHYLTTISAVKVVSDDCSTVENCAQQRQALQDLKHWQLLLNRRLEHYQVTFCRDKFSEDGELLGDNGCDNRPDSPLLIKLWWKNKSSEIVYRYVLEHSI